MKNVIAALLLMLLIFPANHIKAQVSQEDGIYDVSSVTDDTTITVVKDLYKNKSFTTGKGYYFVKYNALEAEDGVIYLGVMHTVNDTLQFMPFSEAITLAKTTSQVTYGGKSMYMYHDVDGKRIWYFAAYFDLMIGDIPAIQYVKGSADNGSFEYYVKVVK